MDILSLTFLLYGFRTVLAFHTVIYEYHYIDVEMAWFDAQKYCREHYTDLATIRSTEEINRLNRPSSYTGTAWIGLFDDPASWKSVMGSDSNSWRWSATGTTNPGGYQNWIPGEPDYNQATNYCGLMSGGLWGDGGCESRLPFVCFTGSTEPGAKQYAFVSTSMSWDDARTHCRQSYTDLAMIEDESENAAVASVIPNQNAWLGLYREPWRWSDGSTSDFTNWLSGQPNNRDRNQHCVWEDNNHYWNDMPCSNVRPFFCAKAFKTKTHQFTVKLQSDINLSDPTFSAQTIKKLGTILQDLGLTDFNLKWKAPPRR